MKGELFFLNENRQKTYKESKLLNRKIDHTLLKSEATDHQVGDLVSEAVEEDFVAVCVPPYMAAGVVKALIPHPTISVCTVVSFPQGNLPLELKLKEAEYLISKGVNEIDFVLNYGEVFAENWDRVQNEMRLMGDLCASGNVISKCIVETPALETPTRFRQVFETLRDYSCIDYIKSSTGMSKRATGIAEIALWNMLRFDDSKPKIKAAGGIKTLADAEAMIKAGADRLGMSASVKVMEELREREAQTLAEGEEETGTVHGASNPSKSTGQFV